MNGILMVSTLYTCADRPKREKKKTEKDKNQSATDVTCGYESYRDCILNRQPEVCFMHYSA